MDYVIFDGPRLVPACSSFVSPSEIQRCFPTLPWVPRRSWNSALQRRFGCVVTSLGGNLQRRSILASSSVLWNRGGALVFLHASRDEIHSIDELQLPRNRCPPVSPAGFRPVCLARWASALERPTAALQLRRRILSSQPQPRTAPGVRPQCPSGGPARNSNPSPVLEFPCRWGKETLTSCFFPDIPVEPDRTGETDRRDGHDNRGSRLAMSMSSARSPINPPRTPSPSSLFSLPVFVCPPDLDFLMAPFLFVASSAVPGDRLGAARQRPRFRDAPSDRSVRRTSARWLGTPFPVRCPPRRWGPLNRQCPARIPTRRVAGWFHVCPHPAADYHAVVAHSGNSGPYPSCVSSPPTPCPSAWGIVFSETSQRKGAGLRR